MASRSVRRGGAAQRRSACAAIAAVLAIGAAGCTSSDPVVDAGATSTTSTTAASGAGLGGALGKLEPEATGAFVGEAAQRTMEAQTGSYYVSMTIDEGGPDELVFLQVEGTYDHDRGVASTVLDISGMVARAPQALSTDPADQTVMKLVFGAPLEVVEDTDTTYLRSDPLLEVLSAPTGWVTMPIDEDETFGGIASAFEVGDLTEFLDGLESAGEVDDLGQEELDGVPVWHYRVEVGDEGAPGGGLFGSIAGQAEDQGTVEVWVDEYGVIHKMTAVGSKAAVLPALGADFGGEDLATLDLGPGDITLVIELYGLGTEVDIAVPDPDDTTPLDDL